MKRLLIVVAVLAVFLTVGYFAFGDRIAAAIVQRAFARVQAGAAARGVHLEGFDFERTSFAGFGAIRCDTISGLVRLDRRLAATERSSFAFTAEQALVDVGGPWRDVLHLELWGAGVAELEDSGAPSGEGILRVNAQADLPFSWRRPTQVAATLEEELRRLWREGRTLLPARFTAAARFAIGPRWHELPLRSQPDPRGGVTIALDPSDVRAISRQYTHELTETEIELVARHPLRAPMLLRFSEQASQASQVQRRRDRAFPYDAYRHVYWSWLLTREFGPEFSEQVTTAHEIGATYESGEAARRMDMQNNEVGRTYALAGVPEAELVQRVLTDPNVVRQLARSP